METWSLEEIQTYKILTIVSQQELNAITGVG